MALTPEEQRALDWQTARRARKQFKRSLQSQLTAPGGNLKTLEENWDPLNYRATVVDKYDEWTLEDIEYDQSHSTLAASVVWGGGHRARHF